MKGFKDKNKKFHPISQSKGVRKSRDHTSMSEGIKLRKKRTQKMQEPDLDRILMKTEKEWEKSLMEYPFKNPKLRNLNWEVSITYEGGFSEEYFGFYAIPKIGTFEGVRYSSFLSNFDWSEGIDEKIQKRIETDDDFAQKQYDIWLADTFDAVSDGFFEQFVDAIEDEYQ